jgi:hypothetical protein
MGGERRRAIAGGLALCQAEGVTVEPVKPAHEAKPTREERLAAQLRANLRRRKQQAREMNRDDAPPPDPSQSGPTLPKPESHR